MKSIPTALTPLDQKRLRTTRCNGYMRGCLCPACEQRDRRLPAKSDTRKAEFTTALAFLERQAS